jgi:hypothetical protein
MQRQELADFASLERKAVADAEGAAAAQCASLQARLEQQGAALDAARAEAAAAQSKLEACQAEVWSSKPVRAWQHILNDACLNPADACLRR